jgi:hypothetical protein
MDEVMRNQLIESMQASTTNMADDVPGIFNFFNERVDSECKVP